jgi:uncharacterized protein (UPF0548 family)
LRTAARFPLGVGLTAWRYMWRTTSVHRWELSGSPETDGPPDLPEDIEREGLQPVGDGAGPLVHRIYRTRIAGSSLTPEQLVERIAADLDGVAPSEFATFQKLHGGEGLSPNDEYVVRMPGPWDGPVRVVAVSPTLFRLATLDGHLEAGQIEFRADADHRSLGFTIESWARSADRFSDFMYSRLGLAKEVQLHMWTSVLSRVVELARGRMDGGIVITTRRLDIGRLEDAPPSRRSRRDDRALAALAQRPVNFDADRPGTYTPENGWHLDDMIEPLPHEPSGPPIEGGSWQLARRLLIDYQLADPRAVRAIYREDAPLAGRDMLLKIRFVGLRFNTGVRVDEVYEEEREVDGRVAQVFGWGYRTLEGHFEQGQMHYEVWKWHDTGDVAFRLHAHSKPAEQGPALLRLGFRLFGRVPQLRFYREVCRRARRLTEAELESARVIAR